MVDYTDLIWSSDWNGYEVGYEDVNVIGLYSLKVNPDIYFYIDVENNEIVEAFCIREHYDE